MTFVYRVSSRARSVRVLTIAVCALFASCEGREASQSTTFDPEVVNASDEKILEKIQGNRLALLAPRSANSDVFAPLVSDEVYACDGRIRGQSYIVEGGKLCVSNGQAWACQRVLIRDDQVVYLGPESADLARANEWRKYLVEETDHQGGPLPSCDVKKQR